MTESGENMSQLTALVLYERISAGMKKKNSFPSNVSQLSLKRSHPFPQMFASFPSNVSRNMTLSLGNPFPVIFLLNSGKFLMKTIFGGYMNSKTHKNELAAPSSTPASTPSSTPASTPSSAGVPNLPLNPHLEKYLLGIKKKDIRWGSGYLSEVRCLADSNRRRRFCRPVTKPLIQGTIH